MLLTFLSYVWTSVMAAAYAEIEVDGFRYYINWSKAKVIKGQYDDLEHVVIKDSVEYEGMMYPVTEISTKAFENCKKLKSVQGRLIEVIGYGAFQHCDSLRVAEFLNADSVGAFAFYDCGQLDSISLPFVDCLPTNCFSGCSSLQSVNVPNVATIRDDVFSGCTSLHDIRVEDRLMFVGNLYFGSGLSTTAWMAAQPDGIVHLGPVAAEWKGDIPSNGLYVFDKCKRLVPYFFKSVRNQNASPVGVTIGEQVDLINEEVFLDCEDLRVLHYNAIDCDVKVRPLRSVSSVRTPFGKTLVSTTTHDHQTVYYYKELIPLDKVTFGDKVKYIPGYLLCNQELKYGFTLPSCLDSIGDFALRCGTSGNPVTCHAIIPPSCGYSAIRNWNVRVPECSVGLYQITSSWAYCNITAINRPQPDINGDGTEDIADVNILINMMLGKTVTDITLEQCDLNGDGVIDIADVNEMLNATLGKVSVPKAETVTFTANGVTFDMIPIEGGRFIMGGTNEQGDDVTDFELPWHVVTLSDYSIGQTEVTQELWQAVMGSNPSHFSDNPKRPVESVSWNDCQTFISRLNELTGQNFRLPTEAEWEYAARGGKKNQSYKFSGGDCLGRLAWTYETSSSLGTDHPNYGPHDVMTKRPNELGIYDMTGNVMEWCNDRYGDYQADAQTNPTGSRTGIERVRRGGGWNYSAPYCRNSFRGHSQPSTTSPAVGLRLAL